MEQKIQAIQTCYNGYLFRSRLEARWAVFFDAMGIEYDYEPQGFRLGYGIPYLPDFALKNVHWRGEKGTYDGKPGMPVYVEVKGVNSYKDIKLDDRVRIEMFANHKPLLVLGSLPIDGSEAFNHGEDDYLMNFRFLDCDYYPAFFSAWDPPGKDREIWICGPDHDEYRFGSADRALSIARQARFEYGETPKADDIKWAVFQEEKRAASSNDYIDDDFSWDEF